ncbi:MAG TPA: TIGR02266 family protein [Polyangia bacterium]|nr:TIGR02266 family protein [Polyangia bacterium]
MTHPAEEARAHIMAGLEACQADPSLADTLEALAMNLAKAQGKLFPAAKLPANNPASIDMMRKAMDYLAQALKTLQDIDSTSEAVGIAAASIARSLKTLHPAVRAALEEAEKRSLPPPAPGPGRGSKGDAGGETVNVNVQTVLSLNTSHQFYTGFSENIEEGGIFVATFEPKPIGSKVLVNFKLPGGRPVTARGLVQWVREYNTMTPDTAPGMGVKFTDLMPEDRKAIEEFAKASAPMFYDE